MAKGTRGGQRNKKTSQTPFSSDEKDAIEYYVGGEGMFINDMLRQRNGLDMSDMTSGDKAFMKDLDSVTSRTYGEDTLYRSVDASMIFGNISDTQYDALVNNIVYGDNQKYTLKQLGNVLTKTQGKQITDKGFMSTSKDYNVVKDWGSFSGSDKPIVLEIKTNKTTKGADISYTDKNVSKSDAQKEVLLGRNQKMQVKSISAKDGNIYVKVDLI